MEISEAQKAVVNLLWLSVIALGGGGVTINLSSLRKWFPPSKYLAKVAYKILSWGGSNSLQRSIPP